MSTVIGILDRDSWLANADNIVVADPSSRTLTWVPRDLWCPSLGDRINRAFLLGGMAGFLTALRELDFFCDHGLVLRRGATELGLENACVEVAVDEPMEFWYPLRPTLPLEKGQKIVSFWPPVERLEGERIHQWIGARKGLGRRTADWDRMRRQQIFVRALLEQKFDFQSIVSDESLIQMSTRAALEEVSGVDVNWRMRTFNRARPETIDGKMVLLRDVERCPRSNFNHPPELAVVVLALGAPSTTVDAVLSLKDQTPEVEVVVVNSGGGNMQSLLRRHGLEVPVIDRDERLYVGAARNIGINVTRAPYVAFLAADCMATPGWAMRRIEAHRNGAAAVASAVINSDPLNAFAWVAHLATWAKRMPSEANGNAFGASYDRALFQEHGLFRDDLARGEDDEFHNRLPLGKRPIWNSSIHTIHRNPTRFWRMIWDQYERGRGAARGRYEVYDESFDCRLVAWRNRTRLALRASRKVSRKYRSSVLLARPIIPIATAAYYLGARSWQREQEKVESPKNRPSAPRGTIAQTLVPSGSLTKQLFESGRGASKKSSRRARVVALFSFRYDAHLVPGLIENLRPIADGYIAYDDRSSASPYTDERQRRMFLLEAARELSAEWVLCVDPDERLEDATADLIPRMTKRDKPIIWKFRLREMYSPSAYRVDGIWGKKKIACLFPLLEGQIFSNAFLHGSRCPINPNYEKRDSGLNIYHLKMITADRRLARRDLYKALDPYSEYQRIGYDYLGDDQGLALKRIGSRRKYSPLHLEEGGLWQPDPAVFHRTLLANNADKPARVILPSAERLEWNGPPLEPAKPGIIT